MAVPLAGVRVIEVANFVAGPMCCMLLGDLGADVTKVELPPTGDPIRNREDESGYGAGFAAINRNKKSVLLDLHDTASRERFTDLVAGADVLVTSVRPRARAALGLAEGALMRHNPRLVFLSLTGYGDRSASLDQPAFDTTVQARSGLLDLIGAAAGRPMAVRILLADQLAALYGALGVVAALGQREHTGLGGLVRTSMLEASLAFATLNHSLHLAHRDAPQPTHLRSAGYLLVAQDGLPFAVHVPPSPEAIWRRFVTTLGLPELLTDARFATKALRETNHALIHDIVNRQAATAPRQAWLDRLAHADLSCAPLHQLREVFDDPLVSGLGMLSWIAGPNGEQLPTIRSAISFGEAPSIEARRAPKLGEQTAEILEPPP